MIFFIPGRFLQAFGAAVGHDFTPINDHDSIAGGFGFAQYVGGKDDGFFFADLLDNLPISTIWLGSNPEVGSSRMRISGIVHHGMGQADPLFIAFGKFADGLVHDVV